MTYLNFTDDPPTGGINALVVDKLNGFVNPYLTKAGAAASNLPLLPTLMRKLPFEIPATPTPTQTGGVNSANEAVGNAGAAGQQKQEGQKVNIAAAAAANVT